MNVEILISAFFAEGQINDDVMAPSDVTSFSIACSHSTNCNSVFDQSASTDSLNDFVFRREFVWQCFVIPKWVTDATYYGVGQTKHFGVSDIANWAGAAPQRYCRTWRMNQCCMFLILITFMNGRCLGAQNPYRDLWSFDTQCDWI